jgi:ferrochelatase
LAEKLGLTKEQYKVTFQSRFGKAKWLEPYTEPTLISMAQAGIQSVDVVCPGFTGDCLETLEEISMEGREAFLHAGGKTFNYIPCMNDEPLWIDGLATISEQHMQGWPTSSHASQANAAALAQAKDLAIGLGAKN